MPYYAFRTRRQTEFVVTRTDCQKSFHSEVVGLRQHKGEKVSYLQDCFPNTIAEYDAFLANLSTKRSVCADPNIRIISETSDKMGSAQHRGCDV